MADRQTHTRKLDVYAAHGVLIPFEPVPNGAPMAWPAAQALRIREKQRERGVPGVNEAIILSGASPHFLGEILAREGLYSTTAYGFNGLGSVRVAPPSEPGGIAVPVYTWTPQGLDTIEFLDPLIPRLFDALTNARVPWTLDKHEAKNAGKVLVHLYDAAIELDFGRGREKNLRLAKQVGDFVRSEARRLGLGGALYRNQSFELRPIPAHEVLKTDGLERILAEREIEARDIRLTVDSNADLGIARLVAANGGEVCVVDNEQQFVSYGDDNHPLTLGTPEALRDLVVDADAEDLWRLTRIQETGSATPQDQVGLRDLREMSRNYRQLVQQLEGEKLEQLLHFSDVVHLSMRVPGRYTTGKIIQGAGGLFVVNRGAVQAAGDTWVGPANPKQDDGPSADKEHGLLGLDDEGGDNRFIELGEDLEREARWYCNNVLWPTNHDEVGVAVAARLSDPERVARGFAAYIEVNRRFAEIVAKGTPRGGNVVVHDYQLMMVPEMLKALRPDINVVMMLHTPLMVEEGLATLSDEERVALLSGLSHADAVAVHVDRWGLRGLNMFQKAFAQDGIHAPRFVTAMAQIDPEKIAAEANDEAALETAKAIYEKYGERLFTGAIGRGDDRKSGMVAAVIAHAKANERIARRVAAEEGIEVDFNNKADVTEKFNALFALKPELKKEFRVFVAACAATRAIPGADDPGSRYLQAIKDSVEEFSSPIAEYEMFYGKERSNGVAVRMVADECAIPSTLDGLNITGLEFAATPKLLRIVAGSSVRYDLVFDYPRGGTLSDAAGSGPFMTESGLWVSAAAPSPLDFTELTRDGSPVDAERDSLAAQIYFGNHALADSMYEMRSWSDEERAERGTAVIARVRQLDPRNWRQNLLSAPHISAYKDFQGQIDGIDRVRDRLRTRAQAIVDRNEPIAAPSSPEALMDFTHRLARSIAEGAQQARDRQVLVEGQRALVGHARANAWKTVQHERVRSWGLDPSVDQSHRVGIPDAARSGAEGREFQGIDRRLVTPAAPSVIASRQPELGREIQTAMGRRCRPQTVPVDATEVEIGNDELEGLWSDVEIPGDGIDPLADVKFLRLEASFGVGD